MQRRRFLVSTAAAAAVALAGCGQRDLQGATENALGEAGIRVADLGFDEDDVLILEYYTEASDERELVIEVDVIARTFASNYGTRPTNVERFDAYALTDADERVAHFYVEPEWIEAFIADDISRDEYLERVEATIETEAPIETESTIGSDSRLESEA